MDSTNRLRIIIDSTGAKANVDNLGKSLKSLEAQGDKTSKSTSVLSSSIKTLTGAMVGYITISQAVSRIDAYANLQNRLKLVTNSQVELNKATQDTYAIAQKTYQEWSSVVQIYQRFSDNAKNLGINMQKTAELTETVSKAVAISGASAASAEAALTQFGQSLASGVFRGEEFNSVAEQTPALLKAIANGLDVDIGKLREMAQNGEITSAVLVKALTKAADSVDEKFSRIQMTIGQSMTYAGNAVTEFASNASGAGNFAAQAIKTLADNLELLSSAAIIGGIALTTKGLFNQVAAVQASVVASNERRISLAAEMQSQLQLTALEVQRTRQVNALALSELNLARQELNSATTREARAAATMRLTQAEIALAIATRDVTIATAADTAAQNANNAAKSRGALLLGAVGGVAGAVTIGVTALAAGYMYMSSRAAEANKKLEEQAQVAQKTREELQKLEGAQRAQAKIDLAESFKQQNEELARLDRQIGNTIAKISSKNTADMQTAKILRDVRTGVMSYDDAFKTLNKTQAASPEIITKLKSEISAYEEQRQKVQQNATAQQDLGVKVTLAGNAAQNAVGKVNSNSNALYSNADAARTAANAQSEYIKSLQKTTQQVAITNKLVAKGWNIERAEMAAKAYQEGGGTISAKDISNIDTYIAETKKLEASKKAVADADRAGARASKSAASASEKAAKQQAKAAEKLESEIASIKERYTYQYADRAKQIELELQEQLAEIRKAGMGAEYEARAKSWADLEKKYFDAQLDYENKEFKLNEREKLAYRAYLSEVAIQKDSQLNDKQKQAALNAVAERTNLELDQIKITSERRILEAEKSFMAQSEYIQKLGELERKEIMANTDFTIEDRKRLALASMRNTDIAQNEDRRSAYDEYTAAFGGGETEFERLNRINDEAKKKGLTSDAQYYLKKRELQASYAADYVSGFSNMLKVSLGEQSAAYKVALGVQRSFAITASLLNFGKAYSDAFADPTAITVGQKFANYAAVAAAGASVISNIMSIKMDGFAEGGYTGQGGKFQPAGIVHRDEIVWSKEDIRRAGGVDTVESMRKNGGSGRISVNIQNLGTPQTYDVQQLDENTVRIIAKDAAQQEVVGQLGNPNSPISTTLKRNMNVGNRR